jgi:hypothetical protein
VTPRCAPLTLLALWLLAAFGCDDDLPRASEIKHMRVLGARTEVQSDSARSTPRPGEVASLTWSVAYPDPTQDDGELASLFLTCTAPTRFSGQPVCQELLDAAQGTTSLLTILGGAGGLQRAPKCADAPDQHLETGPFSLTCVSGTPHSDVKIETSFRAKSKLVQGIICRKGSPVLDIDAPTGVRCDPLSGVKASQMESIPVYGTVPVQYRDEDANHNPTLDAARFAFGESELAWPALTSDEVLEFADDCAEAAKDQQLLSSNGKDEQIVIEYDPEARELHDGTPEPLEFSTYTTLGTLDRRFTVFPADAKPPLKSTLHWSVSKELRDKLGDRSQLVRFYFTVLDHRGGYAITSRELCVGHDLTRASNN